MSTHTKNGIQVAICGYIAGYMRKVYLICYFVIAALNTAFSQPDERDAEEFYKHQNYLMAIPEYKNLLKLERENARFNYMLAMCYLKSHLDKTQAIPYLERAYKQPKYPADLPYYLGYAYMLDYRIDNAEEILNKYKEKVSGKELQRTEKLLKECARAKELMQTPINVEFQNLGEAFNTEYPDYYPFVSADETFIAFNSRRKQTKNKLEFDGYYNCDIFVSSFNGENYMPAKLAGTTVNSNFDDQVVGISTEGDVLFVFSQASEAYGALYLVKRNGTTLGKKEQFITAVNTEKSIETSAFMTPDGQTILFASNRAGGQGGFDLWMVRKLPNGQWAVPQNLGPEINTPFDEDFPTLSYDGTTLYFSSNGHIGMGGFDLYQVSWNPDDNTFTDLKNIGYPLNTPDDERTISYTKDGKHAYISSSRKGGKGDLDIYRVSFSEVEITPAIFNIKLPSGNESAPYLVDAMIYVTTEQGDPVGEYKPSGSGKFTIVLGPGKYNIEVEAAGFKSHSEEIKVNEFTMRMGVIDKQIVLKKE